MPSVAANTFSKEERLCGKTSVAALVSGGKWGSTAHIRYCWLPSERESPNRILVSVPKRYFKRAVMRNLLKRRIREAYRTQKSLLHTAGTDIMFAYGSKECADYRTICDEIASILSRIDRKISQ